MTSTTKIVLVDDDLSTLALMKFALEKQGYTVFTVATGEEALPLIKVEKPRLVMLDLGLPKMNGFDLCRELKHQYSDDISIIILTCSEEKLSKLLGFDLGADDYITKPFDIDELLARVKAVLRRAPNAISEKSAEKFVTINDLRVDFESQTIYKGNQVIELTTKECEILNLLITHRGKPCSREYLLDKVWGYEYFGETRTVDVHIQRLRRKIEDDCDNPQYIATVWGKGYKLK